MKLLRNFAICFVVILSLLATGCPKAQALKTVRDLKVKSAQLSVYGTKLITAFGDANVAGEITREQLAGLNVGSKAFVEAVGIYREAIANAERIVSSGQSLPAGTLDRLNAILNDQVIAAFFDVLAKVGVLSIARSEIVKTTISAIRLTILAIRGAFSDARDLIHLQEGYRNA